VTRVDKVAASTPVSPDRSRPQSKRFLGFIPDGGHDWLPASVLLLALLSAGIGIAFLAFGGTIKHFLFRKPRSYYRS
jgi:hypothetical protein